MSEHIVTLSVSIEDALSGQDACNKAYRMMQQGMSKMQFVVVDDEGNSTIEEPHAGPVQLRLVKEDGE
jgi:hypothetical protein